MKRFHIDLCKFSYKIRTVFFKKEGNNYGRSILQSYDGKLN